MSIEKKLKKRSKQRTLRVRKRLAPKSSLPRISVFRSLNHIYAQLIDDAAGKTLASSSSLALKAKGDKKTVAHSVGVELANKAKEKGVSKVFFDRGKCLYHGRVQALAEGLREGGLTV